VSFSDVTAVTKNQRKPLIFEYYKDISVDDTNKATKGVRTRCERTIYGKYGCNFQPCHTFEGMGREIVVVS